MRLHANARTCPNSRMLLVKRIALRSILEDAVEDGLLERNPAQGLRPRQVAERLGLSAATVTHHLRARERLAARAWRRCPTPPTPR